MLYSKAWAMCLPSYRDPFLSEILNNNILTLYPTLVLLVKTLKKFLRYPLPAGFHVVFFDSVTYAGYYEESHNSTDSLSPLWLVFQSEARQMRV